MKSAREKLLEFIVEQDLTRETIRKFVEKTAGESRDYDFTSGYLESLLIDAIMNLPRKTREEMRDKLQRDAVKYGVDLFSTNT